MKKSSTLFLFTLLLFSITVLTSCQKTKLLPVGSGFLDVDGGKIWYNVVGTGDKTPILLLHGGPGIPSYYLKPLAKLGDERQIIFYDQLGCGHSDRITDPSLMTIDHYKKELGLLIHHLGLRKFYLYGQSWGTMLGTDYYLEHPHGIKALLLSSPALSMKKWMADADILIAALPDSVQQVIRVNEKNKTYTNPAYESAVQLYYEGFVARNLPWSKDLDSCFAQMGDNVYIQMCGPSEFTITGLLKDYDRTDRLKDIKIPTLFIAGQFDEARPATVQYYQSLVPGAKFALIKNAGHLTMQDNPDDNNKAIKDFLDEIEKK
jgi:proline iminopeptidase